MAFPPPPPFQLKNGFVEPAAAMVFLKKLLLHVIRQKFKIVFILYVKYISWNVTKLLVFGGHEISHMF
jgi:hypothetical protein